MDSLLNGERLGKRPHDVNSHKLEKGKKFKRANVKTIKLGRESHKTKHIRSWLKKAVSLCVKAGSVWKTEII